MFDLHTVVLNPDLDVLDSLLARQAVARDDGSGVNVVLDKLLCALEELCSNNDNAGGAIANLLVLEICELNKNLSRRVLDLELL